jgi:hypothetical protein
LLKWLAKIVSYGPLQEVHRPIRAMLSSTLGIQLGSLDTAPATGNLILYVSNYAIKIVDGAPVEVSLLEIVVPVTDMVPVRFKRF